MATFLALDPLFVGVVGVGVVMLAFFFVVTRY